MTTSFKDMIEENFVPVYPLHVGKIAQKHGFSKSKSGFEHPKTGHTIAITRGISKDGMSGTHVGLSTKDGSTVFHGRASDLESHLSKTIKEEQIDELSKKTLGSYVKKASKDAHSNAYDAGEADAAGYDGEADHAMAHVRKRQKGVEKATDRLMKESFKDLLDEACWKGYKQLGMKDKDGKKVPNCVQESAKTNNEARGYHGQHPTSSADEQFAKTHAIVKDLTGADSRTVRDYLDSVHGRHLKGRESDHEYVKKDFSKFKKTYRSEMFESGKLYDGHIQESSKAFKNEYKMSHDDFKKYADYAGATVHKDYDQSLAYAKGSGRHIATYHHTKGTVATDHKLDESIMNEEVKEYSHEHVMRKIRDGDWEATHDVKPGRHLEIIDHNKNKARKMIRVAHPMVEQKIDEAAKLGSAVKIHAPGTDYHEKVGTIGEIRRGPHKTAPKTYTVDYEGHSPEHRNSVQLDRKQFKLHKLEEAHPMVEQKSELRQMMEAELMELSKKTLGSYIKKASGQVGHLATNAMHLKKTADEHSKRSFASKNAPEANFYNDKSAEYHEYSHNASKK